MKLGFVSAILPELSLADVVRVAAAEGYECVERLARQSGSELEPTLHTPSLVNSRRNA